MQQIGDDGADMTRLAFRITDEYGNPLPDAIKIVEFELAGDAELIGENPFPLVGGQAAVYLKASRWPGIVTVRATAGELPPASVTIKIIPR